MYFWRIHRLKAALKRRPLRDGELLPYVILFLLGIAMTNYLRMAGEETVWDGWLAATEAILGVAGTSYLYRRNGGGSSEHFLQRYLVIGWVLAIRLTVFWLPLLIGLVVMSEVSGEYETTATDYIVFTVMAVVYYWRLGDHMADVARSPADASRESG